MNDDRLQQYLSTRADQLPVPTAAPDAVMRRGARRRARKRAGMVAAVAVVGVLGTSLAVREGDAPRAVQSDLAGSPVTPADLDWQLVEPEVTLGYGSPVVRLEDGTRYSLSTAPGRPDEGDADAFTTRTLYRSTDGRDWQPVTLPEGLSSTSLAGAGGTLYAVGTSAAGGQAVRLAATTDGGQGWVSIDLPDDVARLQAEHPTSLSVSIPTVAALDDAHQIVATSVGLNLRPEDYGVAIPQDGWYEQTDTGLTTYAPDNCDPSAADAPCPSKVVATYTFDELGVPADLQAYAGGRTFLFATDDGLTGDEPTTFQRVVLPGDPVGQNVHLLATPDGYRALVSRWVADGTSSTQVFHSADGRTWEAAGAFPAGVGEAGVVDGRATVLTYEQDRSLLRQEGPDGTWTAVDPVEGLELADGETATIFSVGFGPLGLAGVVVVSSEDAPERLLVLHSTDGRSRSFTDLTELAGSSVQAGVAGIDVGADAITLRLADRPDDDPDTVTPTRLLVGTPRG